MRGRWARAREISVVRSFKCQMPKAELSSGDFHCGESPLARSKHERGRNLRRFFPLVSVSPPHC